MKKFISFITTSALLLNSILAPVSVLAQETSPTPEVPTPTVEESATPAEDLILTLTETPVETTTPTIEPTPTPMPEIETPIDSDSLSSVDSSPIDEPSVSEPSATLNVNDEKVEKICITDEEIKDSAESDWTLNETEGYSETKEKVRLGVRYVFPQENKVSVTFKCLPKDESLRTNIKIQKVKVSDLDLPEGTNPYGEYAYDITTGMKDGDFEYDVILPKPDNTDAEVSYIEKTIDQAKDSVTNEDLKEIDSSKLEQGGDTVKAVSIDHFTIYIVTSSTSPVLTTATVNNQTHVDVSPNQSINASGSVKVDDDGDPNFKAIAWKFGSSDTGSWYCYNATNHDKAGTFSWSFDFEAPTSPGDYSISFRTSDQDDCSGRGEQHSSAVTLPNAITVQGVSNPTLSQSCGMDIVLVLDSSDSMGSSDITTVKDAATTLVNALIPATPTKIGVIDFDTSVIGTSLSPTTDKTAILAKINSIGHTSSIEYTNWDAALNAADNMIGAGGLVIIVTDGNPTRSDGPLSDLDDAITHANNIKSSGTRILAVGVNSSGTNGGLNLSNIEAISGPNDITVPPVTVSNINNVDVIMGDISQLASVLVNLTTALCGGTVTVNKYIGSVSESNRAGVDWTFDIAGNSKTTDIHGQTEATTLTAGSGYSVTETNLSAWPGYTLSSASCKNQTDTPVGSSIENGVGSITISDSDIISCDFVNTAPSSGIDWPDDWETPSSCISDPAKDENPASTDLIGDSTTPAVGFAVDSNYAYFRERVNGNPAGSGGYDQYAWVVLFQTSKPQYQYLFSLNGKDEKVQLWQNTSPAGPVDFSPLLNDPAETLLWSDDAYLYSRSVTNPDGSYYVDWAIPLTELQTRGINPSVTKFFATSANENNYNKDHLNCYNNLCDVGINKIDSADPVYKGDTFSYTITVTNTGSDTAENVIVSDILPANFSLTSVSSSQGSCTSLPCNLGSIASGASATITITGSGTAVGTLTNTTNVSTSTLDIDLTNNSDSEDTVVIEKNGNIIIEKQTIPDGSFQTFEFNPSWSDQNFTLSDGQQKNSGSLVAGTYSVSETEPANWKLTDATCVSSIKDTETIGNLELDPGETITCTFTNTQLASISGTKYEDIDGNGVDDGDWQTVQGFVIQLWKWVTDKYENTGFTSITDVNGHFSFINLLPGSYQLREEVKSGWLKLIPSVLGININGLGAGESSQNNNFVNTKYGKIIVKKETLPDGNSESFEFDPSWSSSNFYLTDNQSTNSGDLVPGNYNVKENVDSEKWTVSASCSDGSDPGSISLQSGETVTCTFTNTKHGTITIKKNTVGGNGTFNFTSEKLSNFSITTSGNTGNKVFGNLQSGVYTVTENIPSGWVLSPASGCTDPDGGTGRPNSISGRVDIDLDPGEDIVCTYNNLKVPKLKVIKHVINNNGGSRVASNFTLNVSGGAGPSQSSFSGSETGVDITFSLPGFSYNVDESTATGYTKTIGANCSGKIDWGDEKTCTITNDDIAPTLKLTKTIDYGPKSSGDWTLSANGSELSFTDNGASTIFHTVKAGIPYTLGESVVEGYTQFNTWSCSGGSLSGNVLTLSLDEDVTCTVTNHRDMGSVKVHKHIDLNGDGDWSDVVETSDSYANTNGFSWNFYNRQRSYGVELSSIPTTTSYANYPISENMPSGYHFVSWFNTNERGRDCGNPNGTTMPTEIQINKDVLTEITLCNARDTGTITIVKNAVNDSDENFRFDVSSNFPGGSFELEDDGNPGNGGTPEQRTFKVPTGSYTITESSKNGWKLTGLTCEGDGSYSITEKDRKVDISLKRDESATCTFTNTELAEISGYKFEDKNANGTWDWWIPNFEEGLGNWRIFIDEENGNGLFDGTEPNVLTNNWFWYIPFWTGYYEFDHLMPGTYSICEELQDGWSNTTPICKSIELGPGKHRTVDFGNNRYGSVIVTKFNDINQNGVWDKGGDNPEPTLEGWNINLDNAQKTTGVSGQTTFENVLQGSHSLSEDMQDGWQQTNIYCDSSTPQLTLDSLLGVQVAKAQVQDGYSVDVLAGKTTSCYIGNFEEKPSISIEKSNDSGSGVHAGGIVIYTITLTNNGNIPLYNMFITDALPGGFSYVTGSTTGATTNDPVISGNTLSWYIGTIPSVEDNVRQIQYKTQASSDLADGIYTNFATCSNSEQENQENDYVANTSYRFRFVPISCSLASSTVTIGSGFSYGGNLGGQVLGISTELPATGNPTWILIVAFVAFGAGIALNIYASKKNKKDDKE